MTMWQQGDLLQGKVLRAPIDLDGRNATAWRVVNPDLNLEQIVVLSTPGASKKQWLAAGREAASQGELHDLQFLRDERAFMAVLPDAPNEAVPSHVCRFVDRALGAEPVAPLRSRGRALKATAVACAALLIAGFVSIAVGSRGVAPGLPTSAATSIVRPREASASASAGSAEAAWHAASAAPVAPNKVPSPCASSSRPLAKSPVRSHSQHSYGQARPKAQTGDIYEPW